MSTDGANPAVVPIVRRERRPDRRPQETTRKILDAVIEELRESSYSTLTVRSVATRAGVSSASAYKYFPTKSSLVAAVYLRLLRAAPLQVDMTDAPKKRVIDAMQNMAMVIADQPELTQACAAALMADDTAVWPILADTAREVSDRLSAALGPGWSDSVQSTLEMTFAGALMAARYLTYEQIADQIASAVNLILGASVA
ncbi:TetR/AcrR family transcriptional regulator [Mycobacterium sp. AZCC_0083]|uniref:TetR/AcrR family transcriptional regulator n=1 Tax=Mycobacterium sp. AZCC_0083 TaxID=2735882 RepID=UPI001845037C|nr:TetR/AcrR family transcriptional regulator [Mycobacterium sp. AZCC_0083]MBB5166415.1 AcrR family transcriptional regulator [Mycobacterium sp. AZCC_0083]